MAALFRRKSASGDPQRARSSAGMLRGLSGAGEADVSPTAALAPPSTVAQEEPLTPKLPITPGRYTPIGTKRASGLLSPSETGTAAASSAYRDIVGAADDPEPKQVQSAALEDSALGAADASGVQPGAVLVSVAPVQEEDHAPVDEPVEPMPPASAETDALTSAAAQGHAYGIGPAQEIIPVAHSLLLDELRHAVAQLYGEAASSRGLPAGEGSFAVQSLIGVIEQLLGHALQTKQFGVFRACTFWQYIDSVAQLSSYLRWPTPLPLHSADPTAIVDHFFQVVREVRSAPVPRTDGGRGRCFVRLALQRGLLSGFMQVLAADHALLGLWYGEQALLRHEDALCSSATILSSLQAFDFSALQPFSAHLDLANPFSVSIASGSCPSNSFRKKSPKEGF